MRQWTYSWNSSDGLRHEGEVRARSKDEAYVELRKRGIRPIRVTERIVPVVRRGFKGLRKRDYVCIIFLVAVVAVVVGLFAARRARVAPLVVPSVESIMENPRLREEIKRAIEERKALEEECRKKILRRIEEGTLSRESADWMFKAMGIEVLN